MTIHDLPRIIRFDELQDSGEYGNATCPHCGADGRYVWKFTCADGTRRGAMKGCVKLFPTSPLAAEHQKIMQRQTERERKGQKLASWDEAKLDAINAAAAGTMTEDAALAIVQTQNAKRAAWLKKQGYR